MLAGRKHWLFGPDLVSYLLAVLVESLVADPVGEGDAGDAPGLRARDIRVA